MPRVLSERVTQQCCLQGSWLSAAGSLDMLEEVQVLEGIVHWLLYGFPQHLICHSGMMFHNSDSDLALCHPKGYFEVEKQHKGSSHWSQVPVSTHRNESQFVQKKQKLPMRLNWNGDTERDHSCYWHVETYISVRKHIPTRVGWL